MNASTIENVQPVHCECGRWSGERCCWEGDADETVVIEFVRESQQGTARAAGHWHGSSEAIHVHVECAGLMRGCDPEWTELVDEIPEAHARRYERGLRSGRDIAAERAEARETGS